MERFVKGDIVVIPFPFSDLSDAKKRPALVLIDLPGNDIVLCQITSQSFTDKLAIKIAHEDFSSGSLHRTSYIRPGRIFTADKRIIIRRIGHLHQKSIEKVVEKIVQICLKSKLQL